MGTTSLATGMTALAFATTLSAQDFSAIECTMEGVVRGHRGAPIQAARVHALARPDAARPVATTLSDGEGCYKLVFAWTPGSVVRFEGMGHAPATLEVTPTLPSTQIWQSARLSPARGSFQIRLRAHPGGEPIPGARVVLNNQARQYDHVTAHTDAKGIATFATTPQNMNHAVVLAKGFRPVAVNDAALLQAPLLALRTPEQSPTGALRLRTDFPANEHVTVSILTSKATNVLWSMPLTLDPDGDQTIEGLQAGSYVLRVRGNREFFTHNYTTNVVAGEVRELTLEPRPADQRQITGRVFDRGGHPISGLKLWVRDQALPRRIEVARDGTFRFRSRAPSGSIIPIWPDSDRWTTLAHGKVNQRHTVKPETSDVTIRLRPTTTLRGRVQDQASRPLGGLWVTLPTKERAHTRFDGSFELRVVRERSTAELSVRPHPTLPPIATAALDAPEVDRDHLLVRCPPPTRVRFQLTDPKGAPLEAKDVQLLHTPNLRRWYNFQSIQSGPEGSASARLWPGHYRVGGGPGVAPQYFEVAPDERQLDLRVVLPGN